MKAGQKRSGSSFTFVHHTESDSFLQRFKLHLRPKSANSPSADVHRHLPPLPENKSVVDLFGDYMRYLYNCAKTYIQDTHEDDNELWASVEQQIEYVLTHPNGWEGAQQEQLRKAAIIAGLVPDARAGCSRVHFVTEGEASLHFCIQNGLGTQALKVRHCYPLVTIQANQSECFTPERRWYSYCRCWWRYN
jgi:hypothetical protein